MLPPITFGDVLPDDAGDAQTPPNPLGGNNGSAPNVEPTEND